LDRAMQFSKSKRLALAGARQRVSRARKALKTEQQLLDSRQKTHRQRPVEIS
jgi:hypothetical protein